MKEVNFNELARKAFENARQKGFHDVSYTDMHYLMLVVCELAEAVEADRNGKRAEKKEYERLVNECEDVLRPHLFEMYIKDTVEDELADAVIRLLDYAGMRGLRIPEDFVTKENLELTMNSCWGKSLRYFLRTFAERVYARCINELYESGKDNPENVVYNIFVISELYEIDLIWFIREKMKYNETREVLHGKSY